MDYKSSGVNTEANTQWVKQLQPILSSTYKYGKVESTPNDFAGAYRIHGTKLFACADGVGSKIQLAIEMDKLDTIGIDLVAMNVNDLAACLSRPLFFLDYIGCHSLSKTNLEEILSGIVEGCHQSQCVLLGGETAEMPLTYSEDDADLVGFSVGEAYENNQKTIPPDSVLIGFASSGLHSNGYTLIYKIRQSYSLPEKQLLAPTKIYVDIINQYHDIIYAAAHITGGGLSENIKRAIGNYGARIYPPTWKSVRPIIYDNLEDILTNDVLYKTFNMGIGFVLVVSPDNIEKFTSIGGIKIGHLTSFGKVDIMYNEG